jgi:hypothetical protein
MKKSDGLKHVDFNVNDKNAIALEYFNFRANAV